MDLLAGYGDDSDDEQQDGLLPVPHAPVAAPLPPHQTAPPPIRLPNPLADDDAAPLASTSGVAG